MTLSDRIQHELIAFFSSREPLPFRLTLAGISEHFTVSPMPVRAAVQSLVDQGVLRKQENGRLEINPGALPSEEQVARRAEQFTATNLDQQITSYVVMQGLTRDEHYLREAATAERFDVGRTVVRRVFSRLSGQGLIEHVPRCGWLVRPYREADTIDYLTVRETLELKALQLAHGRLDPRTLQTMRDANQPGDSTDEIKLDNRLHDYIINCSGSRYIRHFFDRNGAYYAAIFDYAALEPEARREMARQHRDILDALIADDEPQARLALSQHILGQRSNVTRLIAHLAERAEVD
ncbi:MAG: FCD domain-containing protein [Planctomycetota bacterium]